eukprot:scaffold39124_cov101-Phaeocystis_antarctica.AAC.1
MRAALARARCPGASAPSRRLRAVLVDLCCAIWVAALAWRLRAVPAAVRWLGASAQSRRVRAFCRVYSVHPAARHSPHVHGPHTAHALSPTGAHIAGGSGTQRPGYRPMRALHATVLSSLGPARKHTAKFEPAAWSWAQMTSGFGEPQ